MDIRPKKNVKYCVHITVRCYNFDFCGVASSVAASLASVKLLLISVVSTNDAKFTTSDIKYFFYACFLPDPEYMMMKLKKISQEIIDQYQLQYLEENGWVYMKIVKGMPGLKQAARLEN